MRRSAGWRHRLNQPHYTACIKVVNTRLVASVKKKMKFSGKQVAAARELLGLTQDELAVAIGVTRVTLSRFERAEGEPQRDTLHKIEAELQRRGIEFTNGDGVGVRLNFTKATEFARAQKESPR